ncbi:ribbon-helix-helix domain-containing protein, partial [Escherichia sp. SP-MK]
MNPGYLLYLSEEAIKRLNKLRGWRKVSRS